MSNDNCNDCEHLIFEEFCVKTKVISEMNWCKQIQNPKIHYCNLFKDKKAKAFMEM